MNSNDLSLPIASLSQIVTNGAAALRGLSLGVRRGEILTLLGQEAPTVLAVLAGFVRPSVGDLILDGRLALDTPPHRRGLGMVTRGLDLFPHLDVLGHAGFAPWVTRAAAVDLLERLDLLSVARQKPRNLPPETRLRVALARALAGKPSLLLLDDPFAALSPREADRVKSWLRAEAAKTGLAVLHCTGDAASSYGFADRVGVIEAGVLRQIGTAQDLYERPDCLFVAQAMGALNLLPGIVLMLEDDIALVRLAGGAVVEGRAADGLRQGTECTLAIRPERIAIAAMNPVDLGEGALAARLCEAVFAGDHMRLTLRVDLRQSKTADLLVIRPGGASLPRNGGISLAWQPHHAHVFAVEAG
jgi:putative spermidine/putrescine transport system ATP-binding protein